MCDYDNEIDAIGLKCPMPILKCKKGLNSLEIGQTLRIKTTDKSAKKDFEAFCSATGNKLLESESIGDGVFRFLIEKNT